MFISQVPRRIPAKNQTNAPADGTYTYTLDGRNTVGGDIATHNEVLESDVFPTFLLLHGFNVLDYSNALSGSTGLLLVCMLELYTLSYHFMGRHLWFAGRTLYVILLSHALDANFQVWFSHTGDDRL